MGSIGGGDYASHILFIEVNGMKFSFDSIKNYFKGTANQMDDDFYTITTGRPFVPNVNMYTDSTYLACLEILSRAMSTVRYELYDEGQNDKDMRRFKKALCVKPNKVQNAVEFWRYMTYCMQAYGNAYAYIKWNQAGGLDELIPLSPSGMHVLVNNTEELFNAGIVYEYLDRSRGHTYTFLEGEILHFKANSRDGIVGIPTSEVLLNVLKNNGLADAYVNEVFKNGFGGVLALTYTSDLNTDARKKLMKQIKEILESQGNRMLAVPIGMDVKLLGSNGIDSSYMDLRDKGVKIISSYFGIPLYLLNEENGAGTSAMTSAQASAFYNMTIAPIVAQISAELTSKLLTERQIQAGVHFENADINGFSVLSANERVDNYVKLASAGILTVNEVRNALGMPKYDKDESGDLLYRNGAFTSGDNGDSTGDKEENITKQDNSKKELSDLEA